MYYNGAEVSYERLLDLFFERVDPTTLNRQGNDAGTQYRSGIYWHTPEQKAAAEKVRAPSRVCGACGGRGWAGKQGGKSA